MSSLLSRKLFNASRFLYKKSHVKSCEIVKLSRNCSAKLYSTDHITNNSNKVNKSTTNESHNLSLGIKAEYEEFRDEDAEIIWDVDEEKRKLDLQKIHALQPGVDRYADLNLERGLTGVFDVEELVEILRKEKAQNIFVVKIPPQYSYVDYMVIVSGKSDRHINALATFTRKAFKLKKRLTTDLIPRIEGEKSKSWLALDLGNIALHIFSALVREKYDLETLWTLGEKYDRTETLESTDNFQARYKEFLVNLQPADDIAPTEDSVQQ